jgi:para-aminobenzoate synthetase/4-amino-4-deoxychorismate lyase
VLRERTLRPEDLHRAEALALVNSLRGWRPAALAAAAADKDVGVTV